MKRIFYGWIIVGISFWIMSIDYAIWYAFPLFYVEILREFDWTRAETAFIYSIGAVVYGVGSAVGGMLLADRIIILLYGQEFATAIPVMQILVWALPSMFLAEILGRTFLSMHLEKKGVRLAIIYALINMTLNVVFIPRLGVVGAAITMVATGLVGNFLSAMIIGPAMLFKDNIGPLLRVVGAGALMGGVVWLLRDVSFLAALDDKIALLLMIGTGAVVYGAAALLLGAISPSEARYIRNVAQRRLRRLGGRQ